MAGEAEFQKYSRGCVYRLIHFYGDDAVNESDLYKELGTLTKDRERWETSIPYVSYYKEIVLNYRRILPTLDVQEIQDLTLAAPKSNKVFEVLQAEVL